MCYERIRNLLCGPRRPAASTTTTITVTPASVPAPPSVVVSNAAVSNPGNSSANTSTSIASAASTPAKKRGEHKHNATMLGIIDDLKAEEESHASSSCFSCC